jgi:peptide/nickel transport system substrate-binding protein
LKRFLSLLLVIVLSITMLAGCRKNKTDVDTDDEGEKVVSKVKDEERILRLDGDNLGYPSVYTVSPKGRGYLLTSFIFDTLTWKDENGIVPMLAKEWRVSEDNKVWTFTLAQNAKFTDGEPVTAEDVKFSFEYIQGHPYQWVSLNMVEKVEAVDAHTVKVTLKDVHAPFITDVAGNVPIMPKHIWEDIKEPEKFNTKEAVIGSGPLMLEKYQEDTGVYVFVANKDYFLGEPVIDRLILSPNNNSKEALEKGEIDGAQQIKYGEAMQIKKDGKFNVIEGPGFWVARLYLNYNEPVFGVKEFRQAMYYAINREELVEKATKNSGVPGNPGHIHPDSEWYYGGIKEYEYDPTKANELLDKANITDSNGDGIREFKGKQLKFELLTTEDRVDDAEMIKAYLGTIGIGLEIKSLDSKSLDALIKEGKFTLAINGHGSFGGDPVLLARFASREGLSGFTPGITTQGGKNWANAEFDEIFAEQLTETDRDIRYKSVSQLQEIIAEELPTLTLYYTKITFAYNQDKFDGWFFTKDGVALAVPTIQNKLVFIKGAWVDK